MGAQKADFYNFLLGYALFNPHIRIRTHWDGQLYEMRETDPAWVKWKPSDPTPPCWYNVPRFTRLLAAYAHEDASRTVRQFVSEFRGLSGSAKVAEVLDQTGARHMRRAI